MIGCQGTSSDSTMSADAQWAPTQSALRTPRATSHCQGQGTMLGRQPHNLPSPPHSSATASRLRRPLSGLRSRGLHSLTACLLYNTFAGDSTKMSYNAAYINFPFAVVGALPSYWDSTLTPHAKAAIARANDSEGTCQHVKL